MLEIQRIARKEFSGFFASPAAFLFLGAFLAVTLFIFFWVETFFSRNIADARPLFQWMPVLLIFLVSALSMRAWSEERRSGTLENLLTSPVHPIHLILGKFLAGLALVSVALALTFPLPVIFSFLGPLDWGPVIGGYIATLFLAAAYVSIGLYMSARTDNPIVALILTAVVCGVFYMLGAPTLTTLFGHGIGGFLSLIGTGSRFESITRGVLDFRDLYYYLSIVGVFLTLNLFTLEKLRWAGNPPSQKHRQWKRFTFLIAANFVAGNFWLQSIGWMRTDITEGNIYSLSSATHQYVSRLQEPLLVRGYFSAKTHPLLAPLVPQIRDLLEEYALAGKGQIHVDFVDPQQDPLLEEEAASKYGIRPVPFQMASRYQTSVVNSYFDLLIAYGDQYETLGYQDLIEIKARGERDLDVVLKNPEYAITQTIRKVLNTYQAGGNPFETLTQPVVFKGYFSEDKKLPEGLDVVRKDLEAVLKDLGKDSGDKFTVQFQDPDAAGGELGQTLQEKYGFQPQIASIFDPNPFWFYMVLEKGEDSVQVPLPRTLNKENLKRAIEAAVKRLAPGFLKTVALVTPESGPGAVGGKHFSRLQEVLSENLRIKESDLKEGQVPVDSDLLMVMAPENLDEKQLFAIDQFLMQGGTVVIATSSFDVDFGQYLQAKTHNSGLQTWLKHLGLTVEEKMVLDPQNAALPLPVKRQIGPIAVREIQMLPYPHFPDIRGVGLNTESPITSNLRQLTVNWASPIHVDEEKNKNRKVVKLLTSSSESWASESMEIIPNYNLHKELGFVPDEERSHHLLALVLEGRFDSFFKDKPSPLFEKQAETPDEEGSTAGGDEEEEEEEKESKPSLKITSVIDRSPESARVILIGANGFASDAVLDLASQGLGTLYVQPIELLQNAVDWVLEDQLLLGIRSRARFSRTLVPMDQTLQMVLEYLNYALAMMGLFGVWLWRRRVRRTMESRHKAILAEV